MDGRNEWVTEKCWADRHQIYTYKQTNNWILEIVKVNGTIVCTAEHRMKVKKSERSN